MQDPTTTEQLSAYLDGELTDAEVAELESRLSRDGGLRAELDQLRAAVDLMRTHGPVQAPPSLYGDILRAVEDEPMPGGAWAWLRRPFGLPLQAVAVAAVAVLIIGVSLGGATWSLGTLGGSDSRLASSEGLSAKDDQGARSGDATQAPAADAELDGDAVADAGSAEEPAASYDTRAPTTKKGELARSKRADLADKEASARRSEGTAGTAAIDPRVASQASNAAPSSAEWAAPDQAAGTADGDGDGSFSMYGGSAQHTIAVKPADLELVASLYQKHAGATKASQATADDLVGLARGTHSRVLSLPDGAARNAFLQDLRRAFPGSFHEKVLPDDKRFTASATEVSLILAVQDIAPSGKADTKTLRSYRAAPETADEVQEQAIPAEQE